MDTTLSKAVLLAALWAGSSICQAITPQAILTVEPGHPRTPPFGLDRVGRPLEAVVEIPGRIGSEPFVHERRAYRLVVGSATVSIRFQSDGPCVNPVFELESPPGALAAVRVDGRPLDRTRYAWDGETLWLDLTISKPACLQLEFAIGG